MLKSRFGGLWVDQSDAVSQLERRIADGIVPANLSEAIYSYIQEGFAVLPGAVPAVLVEDLVRLQNSIAERPGEFQASALNAGWYAEDVMDNPRYRVNDAHAKSQAVRRVSAAPSILEFMEAIFEEPALIHQTLLFKYGSQQALHQDPAYVVLLGSPRSLAASWVALQDVEEGAGELIYIPGSHRLPDFIFGGNRKHFLPSDGHACHEAFVRYLAEESASLGLPVKRFLPNRGDVLIWHSDLVHGGAELASGKLATRKSLVTHYCPISVRPAYFLDTQQTTIVELDGASFSSIVYDLRDSEADRVPNRLDGSHSVLRWPCPGVRLFPSIGSKIEFADGKIIVSAPTDPGFVLEFEKPLRGTEVDIRAHVVAPSGSEFQVFIENDQNDFDEILSKTTPIVDGANFVSLRLPRRRVSRLRIDPGRFGGRYVLANLEVREVY